MDVSTPDRGVPRPPASLLHPAPAPSLPVLSVSGVGAAPPASAAVKGAPTGRIVLTPGGRKVTHPVISPTCRHNAITTSSPSASAAVRRSSVTTPSATSPRSPSSRTSAGVSTSSASPGGAPLLTTSASSTGLRKPSAKQPEAESQSS
ncbi:mucin-2-like isoform X2 [Penaeus indicus]|uniref:mucin-2-like isoform X2 n=1 Tax=Penaeus indicus TaxID=29960 RepID=UPI00300D4C2E